MEVRTGCFMDELIEQIVSYYFDTVFLSHDSNFEIFDQISDSASSISVGYKI